jgi:hypothetical protein
MSLHYIMYNQLHWHIKCCHGTKIYKKNIRTTVFVILQSEEKLQVGSNMTGSDFFSKL